MGLVVAAGLAPEPLLMAGCSWCQGAQPTVCPALQGARLSLLPPGLPPCWQSVPVKGSLLSLPVLTAPRALVQSPMPTSLRTSALVTHTALQGPSTDGH